MKRFVLTFGNPRARNKKGHSVSLINRGLDLNGALKSLQRENWYVFDGGYALSSVSVL